MQYPTYKDLCVNVLLRMGEDKNINDGAILFTNTIVGYLKAIPALLTDALSYLQTSGRFVHRSLDLLVSPVKNLLGEDFSIHSGGNQTFTAAGAQSYFIELAGACSLAVFVGSEKVVDETNTGAQFTKHKGRLTNPGGQPVKIEVTGSYPFLVRNAALYTETFPTDADVHEFSEWKRFDLGALAADFYKLNEQELLQESGVTNITSTPASSYRWESTKTLLLNNTEPGAYRIHYYAYPQVIPQNIADNEVLYLDPEIYALAPLYIEGKLRLINDEDYATTILNEFESRRAELAAGVEIKATAKVILPGGGWIA